MVTKAHILDSTFETFRKEYSQIQPNFFEKNQVKVKMGARFGPFCICQAISPVSKQKEVRYIDSQDALHLHLHLRHHLRPPVHTPPPHTPHPFKPYANQL